MRPCPGGERRTMQSPRAIKSRVALSAGLMFIGFSSTVVRSDDIVLGLDLILALSHALKDQQIDCVQDHVKGLIEEG